MMAFIPGTRPDRWLFLCPKDSFSPALHSYCIFLEGVLVSSLPANCSHWLLQIHNLSLCIQHTLTLSHTQHTHIHITHIHSHPYTHIHTHIHIHTHNTHNTLTHITHTYIAHTFSHTYTLTHIHTHTYIHTLIYIHSHTYIHIHILTHSHTLLHSHTLSHSHIYSHAHILTHMHTHTHSHIPLTPSVITTSRFIICLPFRFPVGSHSLARLYEVIYWLCELLTRLINKWMGFLNEIMAGSTQNPAHI